MVTPREIDPGDRPLRFIVFGESLVSDIGNPIATSARSILDALAGAGHEVTFLEERGNDACIRLLKLRGSRALRGFGARFPGIQHRTYDLPRGWERTVWVGREAGTADAVIALPGTPASLLLEIASLPSRHIVRFIDESFDIEHDGLRLVRAKNEGLESDIPFGPAASRLNADHVRSPRLLVVAYDDPGLATRIAERFAALDPLLVTTGLVDLPGWEYVPETELPDLYSRHERAIVATDDGTGWAAVRQLLPLASGCIPIPVQPEQVTQVETSQLRTPLPDDYAAETQANGIIFATRRSLLRL